ncbi:hypothetical protein BHE74_00056712 [Ensete ventricosum]|nr:hypothetical protein GW17_00004325 [Ensete ventricosum]RWW38087.1 hypothetical protein BHE74_00056712 [Ensete ventricosum]
MRPLAIWAMQWALSPPKAILEAPKINMMDRVLISALNMRMVHDTGVRKIAPKTSCFEVLALKCHPEKLDFPINRSPSIEMPPLDGVQCITTQNQRSHSHAL